MKIFALFLFITYSSYGQSGQAIKSFDNVLKYYKDFLSKGLILVCHEKEKNSPTKETYYAYKFVVSKNDFKYDIKENNSIVRPYNAYIEFTYVLFTNRKEGNIISESGQIYGWDKIDSVFNNLSDNNWCLRFEEGEDNVEYAHFNFLYDRNKWLLQNILDENFRESEIVNFINMSITPYLSITNEKALKYNSEWIKFLKYSN